MADLCCVHIIANVTSGYLVSVNGFSVRWLKNRLWNLVLVEPEDIKIGLDNLFLQSTYCIWS